MSYKHWTRDEEKFLKDNYLKYTDKELSIKLNRTKTSVSIKKYTLGLNNKSKKYTKEEISKIKHLVEQGFTHKEIASIFNINKHCISQLCIRNNIRHENHYMSDTKIYQVWADMRSRCTNSKNGNYKNYGARGISFCKEWCNFKNFYNWAIKNGYEEGLSIDRVNNDGNYCPENCRWANKKQQNSNRRDTRIINAFNENKSIKDWSRDCRCMISYTTLLGRINKGWNAEEAITNGPISHKGKNEL